MQRDPLASTKARKAERKADEKSGLITIKPVKIDVPPTSVTSSGFKKGGFKSAFGGEEVKKEEVSLEDSKRLPNSDDDLKVRQDLIESDTDDEYEHYDPKMPTDCPPSCAGHR